ncbi:hypothetical protein AQUSIP_17720 [Aquicella siphonis]|uniref:Glycosyltransferase RgtA/B/C/D-like domain-containing protein n=1 Tax=Aquicella siphonis TaxID=254247 RepID=A0A5E4PHH5_9COXI|nr:hypothetical protein [Aquicella siphonis]VVC76459.1 hypothetical protein AQUSIP_17720 [Aquicella siphonis]
MRDKALAFVRENQIYFIAFLTSLLISACIDYRDSVINPDGICYLLSAQMVGSAPIKEVMQLCPQSQWPFYSTLIFAFVKLTHLSFPMAAYLLNGLFSLISVMMFICIVRELGGSGRVLWIAALVILFNHQFNILRENIIRDHGFWALYLVSLFYLLRYFREPKWTTALLWNASLLVATLFRIEGAVFLLAMPFISWCFIGRSWKERTLSFLMLNLPMIIICGGIAMWHLVYPQHSVDRLGRVGEVINQMHHGFFMLLDRYQTSKAALAQHVLPPESSTDASVVLFLVWISWYLYNVVITLSLGYAAMLLYAWKTGAARWRANTSVVVWGYVAVNVIVTLGFLAEHLFISKRYLIALSLVLMLWVPFALNDLIEKWGSLRHRAALSLAALVIFISALSGIVEFGHSKFYIRSAGNWIAESVPENAKLYVNDFQLMYYTRHFGIRIFELLPDYLQINSIAHGKWKQYDYLALRLRNREEGEMAGILEELAGLKPVKVFSNRRGNHVAVYKITQKETVS